jgi:hypothetical protein
VAGGHQTKALETITYASVVSRETICLALTIASLNDLEVKLGDVFVGMLTAGCKAFSLVNGKGMGTSDWVIRSLD